MADPGRRAGFVHLKVHSAYSLLEGAIPVKKIPVLARACGMPAVAITDSNNLFGALEFSDTLAADGIQPIIGIALALSVDAPDRAGGARQPDGQVALYAQNAAGYANLMKLASSAFLDPAPHELPHITLEQLDGHSEGLICLTGGADGPLGRRVRNGQMDAARALLARLAKAFGDRLYVELQRHGLAIEAAAEGPMIDLAYQMGLPLVATNECYFADKGMFEAHDALICIADKSLVGAPDRRRLTAEHRFKSPEEMRVLFADLPEAVDATLEIAKRTAFKVAMRAPILPRYDAGTGLDEAGELRRQAEEGLTLRLAHIEAVAPEADYRARLDFELAVIEKMGFPGYFLIVADFIKWAKAQGIPVGPGRGSGAGSLVAYALTITDLDPLRFGLLFERFLNPERVSMPDFDIDFCQERRDEVIRYVQDRYGRDRVAQIITFGKLQARAVLRDVGRVLEMPYGQVDRLCKMVPNNPAKPVTLEQAVKDEPRLQDARRQDEQVKRMLDIGMKLEGLYRHASTHAAGVVIGDRPLDELVPLYRDPGSNMPVTQFNMKWVEPAGLVKFDFLGLKTLTVLTKAVEHIKARGVEIDLANLPLDDRKTFDMLSTGDGMAVFQLEGSGMRDVLRRMKPDTIEDIVALVALYRPGPMDNIPKYIACKQGLEEIDTIHPLLEGVLKETYGVIVYQEQVMQIAQILSGYSLGEADLLRRAMGKKNQAEMDQQRARFVTGAARNNIPPERAEQIFELVDRFAGYGFNKSHAAAYALVAYQTAYLKANYPVEFMAATMTLDLGNTDKLGIYRQELKRMGIPMLGPDVNRSSAEFSVEENAIRYALGAIRGVGAAAMADLVREREANGPFKSLSDVAKRMDPRQVNRRALESLGKAGAFDALEPNRARVVRAADLMIAHAGAAAADRDSSQVSLFGESSGEAGLRLPPAEPWTLTEKLNAEFESIGFYLSAHPLDDYASALRSLKVMSYADLAARARTMSVKTQLAGTIIKVQERKSQRGVPFAFVTLSDATGLYEVTLFSDVLKASRDHLTVGKSVLMPVEAELESDQVKIRATGLRPLDEALKNVVMGLKIFLDNPAPIPSILTRLDKPGKGSVNLVLLLDRSREVEIKLPGAYAITPQLRGAIKAVPGIVDVQEA